MRRLCRECRAAFDAWVDYYQDAGLIRAFRQYGGRMDAEVKTMRVNERAAVIRRQCQLIREQCAANHQTEVAA